MTEHVLPVLREQDVGAQNISVPMEGVAVIHNLLGVWSGIQIIATILLKTVRVAVMPVVIITVRKINGTVEILPHVRLIPQ